MLNRLYLLSANAIAIIGDRAKLLTIVLSLYTVGFPATVNASESLVGVKVRNQSKEIERIPVIHSRSAITIDKSLTTDNTFITATEFTRGKNTLADIIQQSAGVSLNGQGGLFQSYNIRGFSRARIKTEVNGIPIITDRRAGNAIAFLPPALINDVDIKKGPSSTLYGSDALGGVVSLSTINFDNSMISVDVKPQEDAVQFHGNIANDNLAVSVLQRKANNAQSAKSEANNTKELNSQYQQFVSSIAGQYNWHDVDIIVSTLFSQGKDIGKSSAEFPNNKVTFYPSDKHALSKIQFSQNNDWQLSFYHHRQDWQTNIQRINSEPLKSVKRTNITDYQSDTFGSLGLSSWKDMIFGAEWLGRRNIKISEQEFDQHAQLVWQKKKVNASEDTLAFFIQHAFSVKQFQFNTGARYDWKQVKQNLPSSTSASLSKNNDEINEDFISLSLNGQYAINSQTQLGLTIANAFRFPSVSELFFSGETPRGNTQGNPTLAAEESIGYQMHIKHSVQPGLSLFFNGYYYQIENYIERYQLETVEQIALRSYRNSDKVIIQGFELSTHWQINSALSNQFSYQKQLARDIDKNTVDDALPEMLKWQLHWYPEHPYLEKLHIENQLLYQFDKTSFGDSEQPLPSALIWQATLSYQLNKQQSLILSLTNITNKRYRASADEDAALQAERAISIKWQWQFN
jgi:outer membrane receptor protein involved in Fe transport